MTARALNVQATDSPDPGNMSVGTVEFLTGITVTQANPAVCTLTAHGLSDGDAILISGMSEMTELNSNKYIVNQINANTFQLNDEGGVVDSSGFGAAETTGGDAEVLESQRAPTVVPTFSDCIILYDDAIDKRKLIHALIRATERLTHSLT